MFIEDGLIIGCIGAANVLSYLLGIIEPNEVCFYIPLEIELIERPAVGFQVGLWPWLNWTGATVMDFLKISIEVAAPPLL